MTAMNLSRHAVTGESVHASVGATGLVQVSAGGMFTSTSIFLTRVDAMRLAALAAGAPSEALDVDCLGRLGDDNAQIVAIAELIIDHLKRDTPESGQ